MYGINRSNGINMVRKKVVGCAFKRLTEEAGCMTKTSSLKYSKFSAQQYLTSMNPRDVYVIFRARLRTITCKGNMSSSFRRDMSFMQSFNHNSSKHFCRSANSKYMFSFLSLASSMAELTIM